MIMRAAWSQAYSSASIAESSVGACQGAKTSASVDDLAPAQFHFLHNLIVIEPRYRDNNMILF